MAGKSDIVDHVAGSTEGLTKKQVAEVYDAIFDCIGNCLAADDRVTIPDFGSFSTGYRKARTGRNPQTGAPMEIAASTTVKFKAGKELKTRLN